MSLRSTLIASIAVVAILSLLFGAGLSYWHAQSKVSEEMEAAIAVGARIATNAVDDAEEATDPARRLHLLVADFDGDRHIRAVWQDSAGRAIAQSTPAHVKPRVPGWFEALIRQPEASVRVKLPPAFDGLGALVLRTDSRNEIGEVWEDIWKTLTILAVLIGLVCLAVYYILGHALRPLETLARSLAPVSSAGEIPRIPEEGPMEFVKVYNGFNRMAERLARTEEKNRRLNEQLATVQEEERADLARDLHDEIGPFLFSVDVDAASISRFLEDGRHDEIAARVGTIRDSVGHMQRHVKDLLGRLRAAALLDVGLVDAIDNLTSFWKQRYPGVAFHLDVPDRSFGREVDLTLFRIVQESLSNAMRHGQPQRVEILIRATGNGLAVEVIDDGRGLPEAPQRGRKGFGIAGMRERVASLGGRLEVAGCAGRSGVAVSAWLPLAEPGGKPDLALTNDNHAELDKRSRINEQA